MTVQGDLTSLALSDFLQNLEAQQRTGTLCLTIPRGPVAIHFESGAVAMLATPGRPALVDSLVRTGHLSEKALEKARGKRRGSGKSLGDVLVQQKQIAAETLTQFAGVRLHEDLCDLLPEASSGTFRFEEGRPPQRVFDPEERQLDLRVPVGPLLLEGARRSDHWQMIRERVPSDTAHYARVSDSPLGEDFPDLEVGQALFAAFDGSRSVAEVAASLPVPRFRAYTAIAELVSRQRLRAATPTDLGDHARELAATEPEAAANLIDAALETAPHDVALLQLSSEIAEKIGDPARSASARKTLAHIAKEAGDDDAAVAHLAEARRLQPKDPAILERMIDHHIEKRDRDLVVEQGLELVAIYRGPGLHQKARAVLERILGDDEHTPKLALELATTLSELGEVPTATALLSKLGRRLVARRQESDALPLFRAIVELDASDEETARWIAQIESNEFERRRHRRKRLLRQAGLAVAAAALAFLFALDVRGRLAHSEAAREISAQRYIETGQYERAIDRLEAVVEAHPFALASWLEVRPRIETYTARVRD